MTSRLEDMQNLREMTENYERLSNELLYEFFSRTLLLSTKYLKEIIKFTSKNIELKLKIPL